MQHLKKVFLSVAGLWVGLGLAAQTEEWKLNLDSVTVQASRMHIPANRMGKYVTILEKEDLEKLPGNSLDELLRTIPGLEMQMRGIGGAQADISVRGSTFNQVLVLLDGIRVNDPLTGHFSSYIPVPVSSVSRIEVLRGPAAAQFGSDAVGAVINIVTMDPEKTQDSGIDFKGTGFIGENEWISWDATLALSGNNWRLQVGTQAIQTDGHVIDTSGERSDVDSRQFTVSGEWHPSKQWRAYIRGAWDDRDFAARYFYTRSPFDLSRESVSRAFTMAGIEYEGLRGSDSYLRLGYQVTTDSFLFNPAFTGNFHTTDHWDIQAGHQWVPVNNLTLHAGTQWVVSGVESNDRGDHRHFRSGAFMLARWEPLPDLHAHGGVRLEYDKSFEWSLNPQLALYYLINERFSLRGFAGKGIRAADFTERFVSTRLPGVLSSGRNVGNPDLNAESSWSFELGTDLRWPKSILHRMTGFIRYSDDLIDYILTPGSQIGNVSNVSPDSEYFYAQNIALLNTFGWEYLAEYTHTWKENRWVRLSSGLLLLGISGDTNTPSKYIANSSRILWQSSLSLQWGRSNLNIQHLYKLRDSDAAEAIGAELDASYNLVNARLTYRPFGFIPASILIQVDNLLDEQFSDILGARMPGRWVKGGLSLQF